MQLKIRHTGPGNQARPAWLTGQTKNVIYIYNFLQFNLLELFIVHTSAPQLRCLRLRSKVKRTLKTAIVIANCLLGAGVYTIVICYIECSYFLNCERKQIRKNPCAADKKEIHSIYTMHRIGHELFDNIG